MSRSTAAHRAPVSPLAPLFSSRSIIKAAALLTGAIVIALIATNGTYAFLSSSHAVPLTTASGAPAVTISAGNSALAISGSDISAMNLYPGESRASEFSVSASGSVSLALSVASTGTSATGFTATVAKGTCASNSPGVASGSLGVILSPASSATVCVRVGLSVDAPANAVSTQGRIVVGITGAQS